MSNNKETSPEQAKLQTPQALEALHTQLQTEVLSESKTETRRHGILVTTGLLLGLGIGVATSFYWNTIGDWFNLLVGAAIIGILLVGLLLYFLLFFKETILAKVFGVAKAGYEDIFSTLYQPTRQILKERIPTDVYEHTIDPPLQAIEKGARQLIAYQAFRRIRRILLGLFISLIIGLGGIIGTVVLLRQNQLLEVQNQLVEGQRRSSLIFMMSNIMDKVDEEIKVQKDAIRKKLYEAESVEEITDPKVKLDQIQKIENGIDTLKWRLSSSLIGRIAALSQAFKPHQFLDADSLSLPLSPERGQLLMALTKIDLDSTTYARVYATATFAQADLRGADLRAANLQKANLTDANLSYANLYRANLQDCNLKRALLIASELIKAKLSAAVLEEAQLSEAQLDSAELYGANLQYAQLVQSELVGAHLKEANLQGAVLTEANLVGADMKEVVLLNARLKEAVLGNTNLSGARLDSVDLSSFDLSGSNLKEANLAHANLQESNLDQVILSGADLNNAILSLATLQGAQLDYAVLNDAILDHADLTGVDATNAFLIGARLKHAQLAGIQLNHAKLKAADLRGANAQGAILHSTDLRDTNFSRADLQEASFEDADLSRANFNRAVGLSNQALKKASSLFEVKNLSSFIQHFLEVEHPELFVDPLLY